MAPRPAGRTCTRSKREIWLEAKRLIEERKMILPDDPEFIQQASNRRVEYTGTQKLRAESKEAMRDRE
jgi:hypothetical protein